MRISTALLGIALLVATASSCGSASVAKGGPSSPVVTSPRTTPGTTGTTPGTAPVTTEPPTPSAPVPPELVGTTWVLESRITVGGLQPFPTGHGAGMTFAADGTVTVNTGCNSGGGTAVFRADGSFTVESLVLTQRACADADVHAMEEGMLAVLAEPLNDSVQDLGGAAGGTTLTIYPLTVTDTGLHFMALR